MLHALPMPGAVVADKYRIEALLGEGAMGAVFRAHHQLLDKRVALKWLQPGLAIDAEARERFLREARAAARIRHPHVVHLFDVGVHEGTLFLVMELLEGETFEAVLARGALSIPHALSLLIDAMRGVAVAHEHGVVHRDIKPDNIFIQRDPRHPGGVAKVLDFGISKLADDVPRGRNLTRTGAVMGTPAYMSYEQMAGAKNVDERADIYSFGVLLYRALTGFSPFEAPSFSEVAVKVATLRPASPKEIRPDLPTMLDQVVMKAMAFDRDDRYASLGALIDALTILGSTDAYLRAMTLPTVSVPRLNGAAPESDFAAGTREEVANERRTVSRSAARVTNSVRGRRGGLWAAVAVAVLSALGIMRWLPEDGGPALPAGVPPKSSAAVPALAASAGSALEPMAASLVPRSLLDAGQLPQTREAPSQTDAASSIPVTSRPQHSAREATPAKSPRARVVAAPAPLQRAPVLGGPPPAAESAGPAPVPARSGTMRSMDF